mgnify:FL=1|jgi:hypothetical protein
MALGKIKADTLEHSTAGSLDTKFVVNGTCKCYHLGNTDGTSVLKSMNVASMTDTGTGKQTIAFTSNMDGNFFSVCISPQGNVMDKPYIDAESSSGYRGNMVEGSTFTDRSQSTMLHGDLA